MHLKKYIEEIVWSNNDEDKEEMIDELCEALKKLKSYDKKEYKELEEELYVTLYGYVLSDELCKEWVSHMENNDGTKGEHWGVKDTSQVAQQVGVEFGEEVTEYEWWAVMNMAYSDYYGAVPNDAFTYAKMSKAFIFDKDGDEGKVYKYYKNIVK